MQRFWGILRDRYYILCACLIGGTALAAIPSSVHAAALTTWTIDSSLSSLTLSGTLYQTTPKTFIANTTSQGGGSLTTKFSGTIETKQSAFDGLGSPLDIQFLSANVVAANNGSWDPLSGGAIGVGPANYGAKIDIGFLGSINSAIRNLALDLSSVAAPLSGTWFGPQTAATNLNVEFLSGIVDYRGLGIVGAQISAGSDSLIGDTSASASGVTISYGPGGVDGIATLTVPLQLNFNAFFPSSSLEWHMEYQLLGVIVATAPTAEVPEPACVITLVIGVVSSGLILRRCRCRK